MIRSASPDWQYRRDLAIEAIKQRYSPVKTRASQDEDQAYIDDLPALAPQQPLFLNADSENPGLPDDVFAQIKSAIRSADEDADVQKAIEASKDDMGHQIVDDADDSDVSFDEVMPEAQNDKNRKESIQQVQKPSISTEPTSIVPHASMHASYIDLPVTKPTKKHKGDASAQSTKEPSHSSTNLHRPSPLALPTSSSGQEFHLNTKKNTKKASSLQIEIPPPSYRPPSPETQQSRTPRPDLTEQQTQRDTSPQMVATRDELIERDYAQQPSSPVLSARSASPSSPLRQELPFLASVQPGSRPTLLTRTLSSHSQPERSPSPMEFIMPTIDDLLVYQGSRADDAAISGGRLSILSEGRTELSDSNEQELVKSDLQAEVEGGDVRNLLERQPGDRGDKDASIESPEVLYDWSPSPEPIGQKRPSDATLLSVDDPNYVPADIEFPDPEEDLEEDEDDREHVASLTSEQKEYAKFLAELKNKDLDEMEYEVQNELRVLNEQNKKDRKMADDITQQMAKDIQVRTS